MKYCLKPPRKYKNIFEAILLRIVWSFSKKIVNIKSKRTYPDLKKKNATWGRKNRPYTTQTFYFVISRYRFTKIIYFNVENFIFVIWIVYIGSPFYFFCLFRE